MAKKTWKLGNLERSLDGALNMSTDDDILRNLYYDPNSAASFSGVEQLYRQVKSDGHSISRGKIRKWLSKQKVYTTNRHSISKFPRRKTIIPHSYFMLDIDNAYMQNYVKENDGYGYFLLAIDDFSRKAYTRPIKQLKGPNIKNALESIFEESVKLPMYARSDKGTEFVNSVVKSYFIKTWN